MSPTESNSRQRYLLRAQLAGFEDDLEDAEDRQFVDIAKGFRAAAAPSYAACRWAAQDEKNHRWIEELVPRLSTVEQKIASSVERLYAARWTGLPIPVDIVETVDWSGANTILRGATPGAGQLLISNANPGQSAVEVVYHEASHTLMGRNAPLRQALDAAANAAGYRMPGDVWHVVLFYTTGEAVRRALEEAGQPAHTPMLYEIFERGAWTEYRKPLENAWRPYIDGRRSLSEAAADLVAALQKPTS